MPPLTPAGLDPVAGTLPSVAALEAEQARWARALAEGEAIEALAAACRLAEWRVADRPRWFEAAEFRWHRCGARGDVLFAPLLARELRWLYELGDPAFGLGFQALLALCARTPSCWRWASWLGDPFGLPLDPPPPSGQELALRVGPWEVSAAVAWVPPGRRRHRYHGPGRAGRAAAQG